jgi:hypothetical protein
MPRLDPIFVRSQIDLLRLQCPEIDDGDETLRMDMLEAQTDLNQFLDAVIKHKHNMEVLAESIGKLIEQHRIRRARFEQIAEAMRETARKIMEHAGVKKIVLPRATLSIRAGVPKVIITDETLLPPSCIRVKHEPDKPAIAECFARGERVPGAEMSNAQEILTVRIK